MKDRNRRRTDPGKAAAAALGGEVEMRGWYSRIPPPEATWGRCATCGTPARILSEAHGECIKCQVQRVRRNREGSGTTSGPF
jgi:hypothetical protein